MDTVHLLIQELYAKDARHAYQTLLYLEEISKESSILSEYMEELITMCSDPNSYVRSRGFTLVAANAKYDQELLIDQHIDELLSHILDDKPITARCIIKQLPTLAKDKPQLKETIVNALKTADTSIYKESMRDLVQQDIQSALQKIDAAA